MNAAKKKKKIMTSRAPLAGDLEGLDEASVAVEDGHEALICHQSVRGWYDS